MRGMAFARIGLIVKVDNPSWRTAMDKPPYRAEREPLALTGIGCRLAGGVVLRFGKSSSRCGAVAGEKVEYLLAICTDEFRRIADVSPRDDLILGG